MNLRQIRQLAALMNESGLTTVEVTEGDTRILLKKETVAPVAPLPAALPPLAGLILVGISMGLTLIAGIIPSRIASRKDPVVALRTE